MKTKFITAITGLILITGLLLSEANAHVFGNDKKENREVSPFSKISLAVPGQLYLTQGDEYKLEIEGDEDVLDDIETTVKNGRLRIKYDKPFRFSWNNKKVKIFVTTKEVEGLSVSGSGKIIAENDISTEDIEFKVSGSGEIDIDNLMASRINASISGSGDVSIAGMNSAESLNMSISGSGKLHASDLKIRKADISISGSGGCSVYVSDDLEVRVSGSGKVRYRGNPVVNANISGSGKVTKG